MSALQQGNFCSFGVVNLDRQPVVKIIRQKGVNLVRQEVVFYASFSNFVFKTKQKWSQDELTKRLVLLHQLLEGMNAMRLNHLLRQLKI